jgi:hypothetical protein
VDAPPAVALIAEALQPPVRRSAVMAPCDGARVAASAIAPPALRWQAGPVPWAEWPVVLGEGRVPVRMVVVRLDPRRVGLTLAIARDGGTLLPWNLEAAPADALVALNAGQYTDDGPWGWVVHRGREWQPPGSGPLSGAVLVLRDGAVRIEGPDSIARWRGHPDVVEALQSFPLVLSGDGAIPAALCTGAGGLDRGHRDIRLAIGTRADGEVLVALSRYDGAGELGGRLPIGPTTPEMAAIMRALGATAAVLLDGGLSAQLRVRTGDGVRDWPGLRSVPLALVGRAR